MLFQQEIKALKEGSAEKGRQEASGSDEESTQKPNGVREEPAVLYIFS